MEDRRARLSEIARPSVVSRGWREFLPARRRSDKSAFRALFFCIFVFRKGCQEKQKVKKRDGFKTVRPFSYDVLSVNSGDFIRAAQTTGLGDWVNI